MVSEVEKVAKCTPYSQCFQVFDIFKLNNGIYICREYLAYSINMMLCYLYVFAVYTPVVALGPTSIPILCRSHLRIEVFTYSKTSTKCTSHYIALMAKTLNQCGNKRVLCTKLNICFIIITGSMPLLVSY